MRCFAILLLSIYLFQFVEYAASVVAKMDYCRTSCGAVHTVCKYKPCLMTKHNCGEEHNMYPLNERERMEVLHFHNDLRNKVASGMYDNMPSTKRMNVISYSLELEFLAQCWANLCFQHGIEDYCRKTLMNDIIGQNIYITNRPTTYTEISLKEAMEYWEAKKVHLSLESINYLAYVDTKAKSFIQMIWEETTIIGCGRIHYLALTPAAALICNYVPGLVKGEAIYQIGTPACKNDSMVYHRLCGKEVHHNDTTFVAPFDINVDMRSKSVANKLEADALLICYVLMYFPYFSFKYLDKHSVCGC